MQPDEKKILPTTKELQEQLRKKKIADDHEKDLHPVVEDIGRPSDEGGGVMAIPSAANLIRQLKQTRVSVLLKKAELKEPEAAAQSPSVLKNAHFRSMELLTQRQITKKNKELFEREEDEKLQSRSSDALGRPGTPLDDTTPTKSMKQSSADAIADDVKLETKFVPTNISGLRKNRQSLLPAALPGASNAYIPPTIQAAPKSFKEWYKQVLEDHDTKQKAKFDDSLFPFELGLDTLFGKTQDPFTPLDRMSWAATNYTLVRHGDKWNKQQPVKDTDSQDSMVTRTVDILKDGKLSGIEYDDTYNPGVEILAIGTCRQLLDAMIFPLDQDMLYVEVFLATFRYFLPAQNILDCLIGWYNAEADEMKRPGSESFLRKYKKAIQQRSVRVLLTWIKNHWVDFQHDQKLHSDLIVFVDFLEKVSFGTNQKLVQAIREQRLLWYTYRYVPMFTNQKPPGDPSKSWALEWEADDFAHNLTMIDHLFFRQIRPDIYFQLIQKPALVEGGARNVCIKLLLDLCYWFQLVSSYVATTVIKEDGPKRRSLAIKRFIKIARVCRDLKNFHGMASIMYGLKRPTVLIWTGAWEVVPQKYMDLFRELDVIMNERNGFEGYWNAVHAIEPPAVPLLAPYMHQLFDTWTNTPLSYDDDDLDLKQKRINFRKFYDMYSIAAELETLRLSSYNSILKGNRETNNLLVNHIRLFTTGNALGTGTLFSTGHVPPDSDILNSTEATKNIKRIVTLLTGSE